MRMRAKAAVAAGRVAGVMSRVLGMGGGTSLPGAIALRIYPRIIKELAKPLERGSVMVTATNGKTTTANMLASIYRSAGLRPVHNAAGANLAFGVASALMTATSGGDPSGKGTDIEPTIGLFEVDEAVVRNIVNDIDPQVVTVGNIFRDQLDRFGEVDTTAKLIGAGLARLAPGSRAVLNADDPRVAALAKYHPDNAMYFGIEGPISAPAKKSADIQDPDESADSKDSKDCLLCGRPLSYSVRRFSHLGVYSCMGCGFTRPSPEVTASHIKLNLSVSTFKLTTGSGAVDIVLPLPALYNIYNALAAAATAHSMGIGLKEIAAGLRDFRPTFGRFEAIAVNGKNVHLLLIKNPTGFNQALEALSLDDSAKRVFIAINDNLADGTDVSWLWDADVERLGKVEFLLAGGVRAHDMALRLKYAGFSSSAIVTETDFDHALELALSAVPVGGNLYILPTYTALLDIRKRLEKLGGVAAFWRGEPRSEGTIGDLDVEEPDSRTAGPV